MSIEIDEHVDGSIHSLQDHYVAIFLGMQASHRPKALTLFTMLYCQLCVSYPNYFIQKIRCLFFDGVDQEK